MDRVNRPANEQRPVQHTAATLPDPNLLVHAYAFLAKFPGFTCSISVSGFISGDSSRHSQLWLCTVMILALLGVAIAGLVVLLTRGTIRLFHKVFVDVGHDDRQSARGDVCPFGTLSEYGSSTPSRKNELHTPYEPRSTGIPSMERNLGHCYTGHTGANRLFSGRPGDHARHGNFFKTRLSDDDDSSLAAILSSYATPSTNTRWREQHDSPAMHPHQGPFQPPHDRPSQWPHETRRGVMPSWPSSGHHVQRPQQPSSSLNRHRCCITGDSFDSSPCPQGRFEPTQRDGPIGRPRKPTGYYQ